MNAKTVHVIPHTHWDYEWYFTHPESSVQLTYHMDDVFRALDNQQIQQYLLDGQMSIVEDYLDLAPANKEKLQQYIAGGRLKVGPWYTQCDQLIISGESIVRNLLIGSRMADGLGGSWNIGYVPDAFGQSIDMPKIYNGFGIHNSVFWRGPSRDLCPTREFVWNSEDGSHVNCYQIRNGYYLAEPQIAGMDPDQLVSMIGDDTTADALPYPYGADQIKVDFNVRDKIDRFNTHTQTGHHFVESSYDALFDALKATYADAHQYQGEMIEGQFSKIHRSIYSTRYDHKQLNDRVETQLTYVLEPLMTLADQFAIPYKSALVNNIWKTLLRCHAHDSAGGCNSDRTNSHIKHRLITAHEMASANIDYIVRKLSESILNANPDYQLVLINPLPFPRQERSLIEIDTLTPAFVLSDENDDILEYRILDTEQVYHGSIRRTREEQDDALYHYHHKVEISCSLLAMGYRCLKISESEPSHQPHHTVPVTVRHPAGSSLTLRNERYTLSLADGALQLTDHTRSHPTPQAIYLRDTGDDGDNYDYSPPLHDWALHLDFAHATASTTETALSQTLVLQGTWQLPKDLAERQAKQTSAEVAYTLELTLSDEDSPLTLALSLDNTAIDHRMQLVVDSSINATESLADTPFGYVSRPHKHLKWQTWRDEKWKEEPSSIYPMIHTVSLSDAEQSLTLMSNGIKEYEVLNGANPNSSGTVALTLFRSVGWLGKPDLQRRPGIASGQQFKYIPTPDSQLQQTLSFDIGISIDRHYSPANIMRAWQRYAVPFISYQQQDVNRFTNTMKYFGINPPTNDAQPRYSLFELDAPQLVYSTLKHAEAQDSPQHDKVVIRLYNPAGHDLDAAGVIHLAPQVEQACLLDLAENVCEVVPIRDGKLDLNRFKAKQIKTYMLCWSKE